MISRALIIFAILLAGALLAGALPAGALPAPAQPVPAQPAPAEEIALSYGQAPDRPVMHEGFEYVEEDEEAWEGGADVLTDRAVTLYAYFEIAGMDDGLIVAYDYSSASAARPDILYADVNFNCRLDAGEKFPFRPARLPGDDYPPGTDFPLCAEKLSLAAIAGDGCAPFHVNLYAIPVTEETDYAIVPMWFEAWGCCHGALTIDGAEWKVLLRDENVSGSFTDFEGTGDGFDTVTLVPAAGGKASFPQPLRERMLLGGKPFTVSVKKNGRAMMLEPIDVDFGTVTAPAADIEASLSSPVWGTHTVPAGGTLPLPAGSWKVHSFRRIVAATGEFVKFMGPETIGVKLSSGKTETLPALKTAMTPAVTMRGKGDRKRTLSLVLTTAQGATFKDYKNHGAAKPLKGIPVKIADRSGKSVAEGVFPFG